MTNVLQVEHLSASYNDQTVFADVSFSLPEAGVITVVGPNGAGKSTLLKVLCGIRKATSGRFTAGNGKERLQKGFLPQENRQFQDFPATAYEVIESGFKDDHLFWPFLSKAKQQKLDSICSFMEIKDLLLKQYRNLSGGQRRKVLLCRALCAGEQLLLLDEPVAGLDLQSTDILYKLIVRLNMERKAAVLMVSHDLNRALQLPGLIMHFDHGIRFLGTPLEYRKTEFFRNEEEHL